MGMFFARGDGLWTLEDAFVRVDCPLEAAHFAALAGGHVAAVDDGAHLLYLDGALLPCDREIESLLLWRDHALTLSSNTDCLSIADREGWLVTARIGVYPQDMCLLGDDVLVCGGADGSIHRLTLPELLPVADYAVPGVAMRIHADPEVAHVLCTAADDGLVTLLCRVDLVTGHCRCLATLPGIPGAVRGDGSGGVWAASSEHLYHFAARKPVADAAFADFGLIRHIDVRAGEVLVTDPILERCTLISPDMKKLPLIEGELGQAGFYTA